MKQNPFPYTTGHTTRATGTSLTEGRFEPLGQGAQSYLPSQETPQVDTKWPGDRAVQQELDPLWSKQQKDMGHGLTTVLKITLFRHTDLIPTLKVQYYLDGQKVSRCSAKSNKYFSQTFTHNTHKLSFLNPSAKQLLL